MKKITGQAKEEIRAHIAHNGETFFELGDYTVQLIEGSEASFQYNLFPLHERPDEDGEFDLGALIDGGEFDAEDETDALESFFEFIEDEVRSVA